MASSDLLHSVVLTADEADALYRYMEDDANRPYWEGEDAALLQMAHTKLSPRMRLDPPGGVSDGG